MNKNIEYFQGLEMLSQLSNYVGTPLCNAQNNTVYNIPEITYVIIFQTLFNSILGNTPKIKDITTALNLQSLMSNFNTISSNMSKLDFEKVKQAYAISMGCLLGVVICSASAIAFLISSILTSEPKLFNLLVINIIGIGVLYYIGNLNLTLVNKSIATIVSVTPCNKP